MHHLYNTQTEVIVRYSAWQRLKHEPSQDACTVLILQYSAKYFYYRNYYTKRILQSQTEHSPTSREMILKKLNTEQLSR
jgi:uncharacterized protein YvpB